MNAVHTRTRLAHKLLPTRLQKASFKTHTHSLDISRSLILGCRLAGWLARSRHCELLLLLSRESIHLSSFSAASRTLPAAHDWAPARPCACQAAFVCAPLRRYGKVVVHALPRWRRHSRRAGRARAWRCRAVAATSLSPTWVGVCSLPPRPPLTFNVGVVRKRELKREISTRARTTTTGWRRAPRCGRVPTTPASHFALPGETADFGPGLEH